MHYKPAYRTITIHIRLERLHDSKKNQTSKTRVKSQRKAKGVKHKMMTLLSHVVFFVYRLLLCIDFSHVSLTFRFSSNHEALQAIRVGCVRGRCRSVLSRIVYHFQQQPTGPQRKRTKIWPVLRPTRKIKHMTTAQSDPQQRRRTTQRNRRQLTTCHHATTVKSMVPLQTIQCMRFFLGQLPRHSETSSGKKVWQVSRLTRGARRVACSGRCSLATAAPRRSLGKRSCEEHMCTCLRPP